MVTLKTFVFLCSVGFAMVSPRFSYAQTAPSEKVLTGSKELPLELSLLVESLQKNNPDMLAKILPSVLKIDQYARVLSKEDVFMIGKVEIYKTLLKNYEGPSKISVDGASLKILRDALAKPKDNFITWFLLALLQDSKDLIANPSYKEYLLQKNNSMRIEKVEYRKLEKKSSLIQYWVSKIAPEAEDYPQGLRAILIPRMLEALKNIERSFYLLATQTPGAGVGEVLKNESELKFFSLKEAKPQPVLPKPSEKTVDDILAPTLGTSPAAPLSAQDLPKPTEENWLEDENVPSGLKNLPNPSNDANWLQDF